MHAEGRDRARPAGSGISRADAYVTNAVKHFKWVARGNRRIDQRPNGTQIAARDAACSGLVADLVTARKALG